MRKICLSLIAGLAIVHPQFVTAQTDVRPASTQKTEAKASVTSSADPRATEAGMQMLRQGGSAADAAMAMMLALTVVEPQSSGIGGGGFLIYSDGKSKSLSTINGRETAPSSADQARFLDANGAPLPFMKAVLGGRSVGVPGNISLMAATHRKWGKVKWARLFDPAIKLAQDGFIVNQTLSDRLRQIAPLWKDFPETQKIYWVDGKPATAGTVIKNPALAATLKSIAAKGPNAFYRGKLAKELVRTVNSAALNPSDMKLSDLAAYKAQEQKAVCAPYRVYVVCGMGPPSSGATTVLQILGTLERFDLSALGKDNPQSWHLIAEAMQLAYADREKYLGDPRYVTVPVEGMLNRDYIASRSALINPDRAAARFEAGTPPGAGARTAAISGEVAGTTHFVAVDRFGSIATMTSTIEGPFGSQLNANGFMLNNELTDFTFAPEKDGAAVANRVQGGKRPLSSMSPTIVFDANGRAVLALGSAGGKRIIMHVTKTLIGALDFGLPLADAIAMPNIYFSNGTILLEDKTPLAAMAAPISAFGQPAAARDEGSKVNGVQRVDAGWVGAADPRSEGTALAE
jgi:gamma-glutamyltranspeptidase / glutathione hydrolase